MIIHVDVKYMDTRMISWMHTNTFICACVLGAFIRFHKFTCFVLCGRRLCIFVCALCFERSFSPAAGAYICVSCSVEGAYIYVCVLFSEIPLAPTTTSTARFCVCV